MFYHRIRFIHALALGATALLSNAASATFHLMQIEQVIGGVNGDVTEQAVQLRMRAAGQNQLGQSRIRAYDAAGLNPVLITNFETCPAAGACVPGAALGSRVLITSANFNDDTVPATVSNFTMTNLIPATYLAAGSLTFESDSGTIYWRISWGGASYTGPGTVNVANDANSNANPPFAGPLPSTSLQALKFTGIANAPSTTNAADYAVTASSAVFTNNANANFTLQSPPVGACCLTDGDCSPSITQADCTALGGTFQGADSTCQPALCAPAATGACCSNEGLCTDTLSEAQCNASGGVYQGDNTSCLAIDCGKPCHSDITGDGTVDVDDLLQVISQWGTNGKADLDHNGVVDVDDLLHVIADWGPCA